MMDGEKVLSFVEENDIKFVRLFFCDIFGRPKSIAVMSDQLPRVFESGFGFDASAIDGFMNIAETDLLLHPCPETFCVLPWRPAMGGVARMFCDIRHAGGAPFEGDGRFLLRSAVERAALAGYSFKFRSKCEFYLFELDEKGGYTTKPHDSAGYLDIPPLDKGENLRREICLTLEELGDCPESCHHEKGPGQNQIDCRLRDAVESADDFVSFKSVVRTIAARDGLFASFMPKPLDDESGSGLHFDISIFKNGSERALGMGTEVEGAIAGILEHIEEMTLFFNTTTNSYLRLGSFEAPRYVSWVGANRAQLLLAKTARDGSSRLVLRSPDPLCNPYIAYALIIEAAMEGILSRSRPGAPADLDLSKAPAELLHQYKSLPDNLGAAVELAEGSQFLKKHLALPVLEKVAQCKRAEWEACWKAKDRRQFEMASYFDSL